MPPESDLPTFADLALPDALKAAVADKGFERPTPIQAAALPHLLAGRDVTGQARTGSGKTAAFGLALLTRIEPTDRRVQALVLCPTRELAAQVASDLRAYGKRIPGLTVLVVAGGQLAKPQTVALSRGVHVVVGTPGRVLDHLRRGNLVVDGLRTLVLDEADRMLELGFTDEMAAIASFLPTDRLTALFSATFPPGVLALAASWQRDPERVAVDARGPELDAFAVVAPTDAKTRAVDAVLRHHAPATALVFCNQRKDAADVAVALARAGHAAVALHGDLEQVDRDAIMGAFRCGGVRVLVATDVAARGLDVAGLDLVVQHDLPFQADVYVHRVGRTGRAGRRGTTVAVVTPAERPHLPTLAAGSAPPTEVSTPSASGPALRADWRVLRLGAGRKDKLRRGDVLGALTGDAGLAGDDVGAIDVGERVTFVAVRPDVARMALQGLARAGVKGRRIRAELLPSATEA
jgi:ATP-independent RNA helicase DbpA